MFFRNPSYDLEVQATLAGAIRECCHTTVVLIAASVKRDCLDTGLLRASSDELADLSSLGRLVITDDADAKV